MKKFYQASLVLPLLLSACSGVSPALNCAYNDANCDQVPDDLGTKVLTSSGAWAQIDFNGDGIGDGLGVDTNGDGKPDGALIDTDNDGLGDALDLSGNGVADVVTSYLRTDTTGGSTTTGTVGSGSGGQQNTNPGSGGVVQSGSGGAPISTSSGGAPASGSGGANNNGGSIFGDPVDTDMTGGCLLSDQSPVPGTTTTDRYFETDIKRGGVNYMFIANGWGDGWKSHTIKTTTRGTAYEVAQFDGNETGQGVPAGYPSVFCGNYSMKNSGECGLTSPKAISSITSMMTGLKWSHDANDGKYNIAYDVWLTNGSSLAGYFMVWFRDPAGAQPAGAKTKAGVTVGSVPGTWDVWTGSVNGLPIVNYVRPENSPTHELAFDLKEFFDHAKNNGITLPGSSVMAVAIGSEIWQGPVTSLKIEDFCVDVK